MTDTLPLEMCTFFPHFMAMLHPNMTHDLGDSFSNEVSCGVGSYRPANQKAKES